MPGNIYMSPVTTKVARNTRNACPATTTVLIQLGGVIRILDGWGLVE